MLELIKKKYSMREIFISCITAFVILTSIYFQKINKEESTKSILLQNSSLKSKFNSGITIQDAGEVIVIEQKPNDATVIIDKNDLDDIIVFLNTKSESE